MLKRERNVIDKLLFAVLAFTLLMSITGVVSAQTVPVFVAAGTEQSGAGATFGVPWPGHLTGDIGFLFIESAGGEAATLTTANGFVAVTNSPQFTGAGTAGTRITVFWARATSGGMLSPVVAGPGNHVYARILTYRNVINTGNPWGTNPVGGVKTPASATVTVTGLTTTAVNSLVVQAVARDITGAGAMFGVPVNANLTDINVRSDAGTISGNGGGFGVWDGLNATADAIGNTTNTVTSSINAFLTIELRPNIYYSRAGGGNWATGSVWSNAGCNGASAAQVPTAGSHVVICSADTVTLNTNTATLASLTVNSGGILNIGNNATARTLTVTGDITNAGTLRYNTAANHTITIGGSMVNSGTFDIAAVTTSAILNITGNITNTGTFDLAVDADTLANTTLAGGGTHTIDGNGAMEFNNVTVNNNLTINKTAGAITQTGTFSVTNDLVITQGTLNLANTSTVTGTTSITGTLGHPTATGTRAFTGPVTINTGGTWNNSGNAVVTMGNSLDNDGTFTSGTGQYTFQTTAGAVWDGDSGLVFSGAVAVNATRTNNTTTTVTGDLTGSATLTNAGTERLRIGGASTITGLTATASNNIVEYFGTVAQTVKTTDYYHLEVNKSTNPATTTTGTVNVAGNVTVTAGTLNLADTTVTVTGLTSITGTLVITNTTGTKTFNGNVTVNPGGSWNHTVNSPVAMNGNLTNNGSFTANTGAAAIYTFGGGSAQTITGTASGTTTFARLTLNNTNGLSLTGTHNVEVTTLLTLNVNNRITTTSNNYIYISNGSAITGAGANSFVVGNLRKRFTATGLLTRVYEVGTVTGGVRYAPVSVTLGNVSVIGDFTVSSTAGDHAQITTSSLDPTLSINRFWTLTGNTVNFNANASTSIVFTFIDPDDYDGGADFTTFDVGRYNAPDWAEVTPSARSNTTTTISGTGITAASIGGDYQIAKSDRAATVFTAATGGSAISADTNSTSGTGTYTSLTGPVIHETNNGGMAVGNFTLTAPAGFQFDTGTNVTITIGTVSGSGTNLSLSSTSVTPTATTITFAVATTSTATRLNSLTFTNMRVRPTADCPLATSGNIVFATATATSITSNNAGTLTEVSGTAAEMYTVLPGQTAYSSTSCGTISGTPTDPYEDDPFTISQLVVTDQFGNAQTGYDNAGVTITYVYSGPGTPSFTSPVSFTDGVSTTTLTTTLDTPATNVTITSSANLITGIASTTFNVLAAPTAIVNYEMEQTSWSGAAGEVLDISGNNLHGTALNGPNTSNATPAIAGDPGTCYYGEFNQGNDLVQRADNALLDITTTLTITSWVYTTSWPGSDLKTILSKDANYEYHLNPTGKVFWSWGGGAQSLTSVSSIPLNQWHHIAIVYNSGNATIYIDGVLDATTTDGIGTLTTNNSALEIAADQSFAGRNFDGWIDEVRIYTGVLSGPQINVVKNETHPCPNAATLIADWHMDGPGWTGTGDTVIDSSGNNYNGTTNNVTNVIGLVCDAANLGANSATDYLDMNVNALDNRTNLSIAAWVKTPNTGNQALISGAKAAEDDELLMWFPNNTSFRPVVSGSAQGGTAITIPSLTAVNPDISGADNTWHHVVWTRYRGTNCVYVDGDYTGCLTNQPSAAVDIESLIIGQEQDSVGGGFSAAEDWEGYVDELMVYNGVLTASGIQTIYNNHLAGNNYNGSNRYCPVVQYNITHDGTGMSCLSETVTITAIDAHGDATDPGNVIINLSVDPLAGLPKGTWARRISPTGTLSNNATTDGTADYQFPGGISSVQLAFNYTALAPGNNSETINFDVEDTNNITDTRDSNAITDPDMTFYLTGFQFYNYDTSDEIIPVQIAGKPSNIAPLNDLIALRAMRVSDEDPSVCESAFPDGSSVTIPIGAECRSPTSCSVRDVLINSTAVDTNNDNTGAGTSSYTNVVLSFEDDGITPGVTRAPLIINYPDAGKIQLHARYEVPLDDGGSPPTGSGSGGYMEGSSQQFIVRPFALAITDIEAGATPNPGSLTATDTKFTSAGSDFSVKVGAYLWAAADDDGLPWGVANDGIPDSRVAGVFTEGVNLIDNTALVGSALALNFKADGTLMVTSPTSLYAPSGGVLGTLNNGAVVAADFSGGEALIPDVQYMEVGSFMMLAQFDDYLGDVSVDVTGASYWNGTLDSSGNSTGTIGRFVPYDFDISLNTPEFGTQCTAFTYVGQPFEFTADPVMTVTARAEGGSITANYTGSFNQLTAATLNFPVGSDEGFREGSVAMLGLDTGLISGWSPTITDLGTGSIDLTFSFGAGEKISFNRVTPVAPFDAEISLEINVVDDDGVFYGDGAGTEINPAKFGDTGAGQGIDFSLDKEQRWGRLTVGNAFGSELLPVTIDLLSEYYLDASTGFVPNTNDSCTVYQAADINIVDVNLSDSLNAADVAVLVPAVATTLVNGRSDPVNLLTVSDNAVSTAGPGAGKTGTVQLTLDLSALTGSMQDWLQFDWADIDTLGNGPYDGNPASRASFGIYKSSNDIIYIREPWN